MAHRTPRFLQAQAGAAHDERADVLAGLARTPAEVSPKHFYDALGSRLFDAITELPEYYPTRTEAALFDAHGAALARRIGAGATLVDVGAGSCEKAARLLPLIDPVRYVALDISADYLHESLRRLQRDHPALDIVGVGIDFMRSPWLPAGVLAPAARPVFFYPGSSIGNFTPADAQAFLGALHAQAAGGGLLLGVDLVKPRERLEAAYDDALGVTAAFNLNLLRNLNRLVGTDFDVADWRHVALYDERASRIEMHLQARREVRVRWPGGERRFGSGERIHTENSYKYTPAGIAALVTAAGWRAPTLWRADDDAFALLWAEA